MPEEQTSKSCKCPYSCNRHGNCKACMEYHFKTGSKTNCGAYGKPKESK